jgi:hypothetical protein
VDVEKKRDQASNADSRRREERRKRKWHGHAGRMRRRT